MAVNVCLSTLSVHKHSCSCVLTMSNVCVCVCDGGVSEVTTSLCECKRKTCKQDEINRGGLGGGCAFYISYYNMYTACGRY